MKKIFLPLIGALLVTMLSAFTCYDFEQEYGNSVLADTVVKDTTDTVMTIKHIPAEEWAD